MNDLIDKIEDILEEAKFHNEYGEDICLDNQEELAQKIYDLFVTESTHGYMCMTDYDYELGVAKGGNVVYPSVEDIKENRSCVSECGIVKVAVRAIEVTQEQDYSGLLDDEDINQI